MKAAMIVILLNQLGFYPHSPKIAIVTGQPAAAVFYVVRIPVGDTVYSGALGPAVASSNSSLRTYDADFTGFEKEGDYRVVVPGGERIALLVGVEEVPPGRAEEPQHR